MFCVVDFKYLFFFPLIQGLVRIEEGLRELEHAIVRQYREGENDLIETYLHHRVGYTLCAFKLSSIMKSPVFIEGYDGG